MKNMKLLLILFIGMILLSCSNNDKSKTEINKIDTEGNSIIDTLVLEKSAGYNLMKQYCYICHMPKSRDNMIAPPLFRVKEHYQPVYKTKDEFVDAIVKWAVNPVEAGALMPGAVRKFECMPSQSHIPKDTLRQIAAYIFDNEMEKPKFFAEMHDGSGNGKGEGRGNGMGNGNNIGRGKLVLNDGKKWKVADNVLITMNEAKKLIDSFDGKTKEDYQKFGKDVFNITKQLLLNKENSGEIWEQLHNFFNKLEEDMHSLMSIKTIEEGEKLKNKISNKVEKFGDFFE